MIIFYFHIEHRRCVKVKTNKKATKNYMLILTYIPVIISEVIFVFLENVYISFCKLSLPEYFLDFCIIIKWYLSKCFKIRAGFTPRTSGWHLPYVYFRAAGKFSYHQNR